MVWRLQLPECPAPEAGAGQAGNAVPPASFSIGKGRESGRGPLSLPKPLAAGYCHPAWFPATAGLSSPGWSDGPGGGWARREGTGSPDAWFWKRLGTATQGSGEAPSVAVASRPHPRGTGGPLGPPSADNTEALLCGGGEGWCLQGRKESRQREQQTQN